MPRQPVGRDGRKRGIRGYDAGKKVTGRERHVVDSLGLLHGLAVHPADVQDRDGAKLVMGRMAGTRAAGGERVWADGGYDGQLVVWARERTGWAIEIVKRPEDAAGSVALPRP